MIEIGVEEFVRRLRRLLGRDGLVAFFLGAGASQSSGIPAAGALTTRWVAELHETEAGRDGDFEAWRRAHCPDFDEAEPAGAYASVMRRLFPTQAERQGEIERVVTGHDPGFAYATLAQLMAHDALGPRCNVVLTTNFDDLVADALYLYTRSRPLVVTHEALVGYAAVGRKRATVIKLHGDAMLQPRNTEEEIAELAPELVDALRRHLHSRALVVIGYGGNDRGVFRALSALPRETISHGIYWVNDRLPANECGDWLRGQAEAFHVRHLDFDELMAVVKTEFDLPNPDERRFSDLMERYRDTFAALQGRVRAKAEPSSLVARSVEEVRKRFGSWFSVELEAQKFKEADPDRAGRIYEEGIAELPDSAPLLGNFAIFLQTARGDHDRAQGLYERALAADPGQAHNLSNYAAFLSTVRGDHDRAEALYERALAAGPDEPATLANFAAFLSGVRADHDRAEALYERALAADPGHANTLGNYAAFLHVVRHDHDRAEALYEQAVAADPANADHVGNLAVFMKNVRSDHDRAEALYQQALAADPGHANNLGGYALFLQTVRGDPDRARALYERAVAADPGHANTLGNYAGLLFAAGARERAMELAARAESSPGFQGAGSAGLRVEVRFYLLANGRLPDGDRRATAARLRADLEAGARSRGWDFGPNIDRAGRDGAGEEELRFLSTLAAVITGEAALGALDGFAQWKG